MTLKMNIKIQKRLKVENVQMKTIIKKYHFAILGVGNLATKFP